MRALLSIALALSMAMNAFFMFEAFHWRSEALRAQSASTSLVEKNARLEKAALEAANASQPKRSAQPSADLQELSGIYSVYFTSQEGGGSLVVDLRSDGTAQVKNNRWSDAMQPSRWARDGNRIFVNSAGDFTLEGFDLIDKRGKRWLRRR